MTFTSELLIYLLACIFGCAAAALSLRLISLILGAAESRSAHEDVIATTKHIRLMTVLLTLGWAGFATIGGVALFTPPPTSPIGTTPIGLLLRWILIGTVVLWSVKTTANYLFLRNQWQRHQPKPSGG